MKPELIKLLEYIEKWKCSIVIYVDKEPELRVYNIPLSTLYKFPTTSGSFSLQDTLPENFSFTLEPGLTRHSGFFADEYNNKEFEIGGIECSYRKDIDGNEKLDVSVKFNDSIGSGLNEHEFDFYLNKIVFT